MWCDTFDADLLKVVPGAVKALGETAGLELTTRSHITSGKINAPSCWNTSFGLAAFFWTAAGAPPDACWHTNDPEVRCTLLEAVRDEWVHDAAVVIDGRVIWRPPVALMMRLMYDVRGWTVLDDAQRGRIRESVLASLRAAAGRLTGGSGG